MPGFIVNKFITFLIHLDNLSWQEAALLFRHVLDPECSNQPDKLPHIEVHHEILYTLYIYQVLCRKIRQNKIRLHQMEQRHHHHKIYQIIPN